MGHLRERIRPRPLFAASPPTVKTTLLLRMQSARNACRHGKRRVPHDGLRTHDRPLGEMGDAIP